MLGMNKLPIAKRAQILSMLTEGASMRSVSRLADVSINTVSKLLVEAGKFGGIYAPLLPAEGIMVMGEVKTVEPLREPGR